MIIVFPGLLRRLAILAPFGGCILSHLGASIDLRVEAAQLRPNRSTGLTSNLNKHTQLNTSICTQKWNIRLESLENFEIKCVKRYCQIHSTELIERIFREFTRIPERTFSI